MLSLMLMRPKHTFLASLTAAALLGGTLPGTGHAEGTALPPVVTLPAAAREITGAEAATLVRTQRVNILDIRTATEMKEEGRIPGSKHLDFFRDDFDQVLREQVKMDPAMPCLVYCALGGRSRHAAQRLADLGFKEILVLKGGYNAWKKAGLPMETLR